MEDEQNFQTLTEKLNENINEVEEVQEENKENKDNTPLYCPYCDWKTHAGAKDKERGLRNHIKLKHPEKYEEIYKTKTKTKKPKQIEILPPKISELKDDIELIGEEDDQKKEKLLGDLDLLSTKFKDINFNWNYNQNSSVKHLQRQKALFLRVLNDEAGTDAIFNLLVVSSKGLEKIADATNLINIDGYASDVQNNKKDIYPILKNMVDTGALDVGHLSPELRLGMIMTSLAINRIEVNKSTSNNFLEGEENLEP